ncbi:hypothetical protein F383_37697 [Gossypium arboreum]|uniref:Uncharacterized protein n=1 Tax=Gossypium arboreum TaxID=29729 RepID=A0A0B0MHV9_GOSAR|nr:hypothetical protein F383_37697 [Gossypium arboreum]
MFIGGVFFLV